MDALGFNAGAAEPEDFSRINGFGKGQNGWSDRHWLIQVADPILTWAASHCEDYRAVFRAGAWTHERRAGSHVFRCHDVPIA